MNFKSILIVVILVCNLFAQEEKLKIGILYEKIFSSKKEAEVGISLWMKQSSIENFADKIELLMYKDENKLLEDFKSGKIPVLFANATFYYKNRKTLKNLFSTKWIMSRIEEKFEEFYLIKNRDTKADFTDKSISNIYYKIDLSKVWIQTLAYKENKTQERVFKKLKKLDTSKKLVYNAFFKKGVYSIVSKELYNLMASLNPQIKDKTVIVKKSKPIFFRAIGFTRKDIDKKFNTLVDGLITTINRNKANFEMLSFLEVQTVYVLDDKDLEELGKMYDIYFSMNKD